MYKPKQGGVYLDALNQLFEIIKIDEFSLNQSKFNKAISVKFISTLQVGFVSSYWFKSNVIKYIGDNSQAARILYEPTIKEVHNNEKIELNDFDHLLAKFDNSNDE